MTDQDDHQQTENEMENDDCQIARLREQVSQLKYDNDWLRENNVRLQEQLDQSTQEANENEADFEEEEANEDEAYFEDEEANQDEAYFEDEDSPQVSTITRVRKRFCKIFTRLITGPVRYWQAKRQAKRWNADLGEEVQYDDNDGPEDDRWKPAPEREPVPDHMICDKCISWNALWEQRQKYPQWDPVQSSLDEFWKSPAQYIYISWEDQYTALHKAHALAKQTFWYAFHAHWPEQARAQFGEHWDQVRFGRDEIEKSGLSWAGRPEKTLQMCNATREMTIGSMYSVTSLRNAVCHPSQSLTMRNLDALLCTAENLARILDDKPRVCEIQNLRRGVMIKAIEAYEIIEARTTTPFLKEPPTEGTNLQLRARRAFDAVECAPQTVHDDRPYPYHIQHTLRRIYNDVYHSSPPGDKDYPAVLLQAAKLWKARGFGRGEDDPDYQQRVITSQSWVRDDDRPVDEDVAEPPSGDNSTEAQETAEVRSEIEQVQEPEAEPQSQDQDVDAGEETHADRLSLLEAECNE
ncbi:unnamed protein product [Cercospora beticola]|nr:unnamed protein product [Cercospora beticola]